MGMFILLGAALYIFIAIVVIKYVWGKTQRKLYAWLTAIFFVVLATGDNIVNNIYFRYLCYTQGGMRIYKTVENAEGYLKENSFNGCDPGSQVKLLKGTYSFIEVNVIYPKKEYLTEEAGLHRFYLAKRGDPNCKIYEDYYEHDIKSKYLKEYPKEYCIVSEKVDRLKSKYSYLPHVFDRNYLPLVHIAKGETFVRDIQSGNVLGSLTRFVYYGSWLNAWLDMGHKSCPKNDTDPDLLLEQVLKPNKPK